MTARPEHAQVVWGAAFDGGGAVVIPYLMCGHPSPAETVDLLLALERGGAGVVELGMPFSDPLADGPTIQRAATAALKQGITVEACIATAGAARDAGLTVPLVLMGYANPVLAYGVERFCVNARAAGIDGVIIADLPPEEAGDLLEHASQHGLAVIFLVTPVTTDERIRDVAALGSGFLYCVARTGSTGAGAELDPGVVEFLARVKQLTDLPTAVGFGISTPEHAGVLAPYVDGVVVGSALLDLLDATSPAERATKLESFVRSLVQAVAT